MQQQVASTAEPPEEANEGFDASRILVTDHSAVPVALRLLRHHGPACSNGAH